MQFNEIITTSEHTSFLLKLPMWYEALGKGVSSLDFRWTQISEAPLLNLGFEHLIVVWDPKSYSTGFFLRYSGSIPYIFLFWSCHVKKVLFLTSRKMFLNHILYLLLLCNLSPIITPPSTGSVSFKSWRRSNSPRVNMMSKGQAQNFDFMTIQEVIQVVKKALSPPEIIW